MKLYWCDTISLPSPPSQLDGIKETNVIKLFHPKKRLFYFQLPSEYQYHKWLATLQELCDCDVNKYGLDDWFSALLSCSYPNCTYSVGGFSHYNKLWRYLFCSLFLCNETCILYLCTGMLIFMLLQHQSQYNFKWHANHYNAVHVSRQ